MNYPSKHKPLTQSMLDQCELSQQKQTIDTINAGSMLGQWFVFAGMFIAKEKNL